MGLLEKSIGRYIRRWNALDCTRIVFRDEGHEKIRKIAAVLAIKQKSSQNLSGACFATIAIRGHSRRPKQASRPSAVTTVS